MRKFEMIKWFSARDICAKYLTLRLAHARREKTF